jgi:UPF0755 protein
MLKKLKIISIFILVILAVFILFFISYWRGISAPLDEKGRDKVFVVSRGESVKDIAANLYDSGLINSKTYFEIYIWRTKKEKDLQAGEYILNPKMNIKEIAEIISGGEVLNKELTIKIIEGWRIKEINDYFVKNNIIKNNSFIDLAGAKKKDWARSFMDEEPKFLADLPGDANLEGYLFPDTYRIYKDAKAEDIIYKMIDNFGEKVNGQMRDDIKKQGKTIYEIIKMASLIEKEVRTPEDMKIVAGIFWTRLKVGQPLESDASLSYILDDKKPSHSAAELALDSPYNTYKYKGLPPTPICNPGLNAIQAAIYPTDTQYNYFLTKPDSDEVVFSKTYKEHLENKNKYLK